MKPALEWTAHHEAGHAVVAWSLGYDVSLIELYEETQQRDGKDRYGNMSYRNRSLEILALIQNVCRAASPSACQCDHIRLAMEMVVAWGGPASDLQMGYIEDSIEEMSSGDVKDAVGMASEIESDGETAALLANAMRKLAMILVDRHRPCIETLASALLANGKILVREEIQRLLGEPVDPQETIAEVARKAACWRAIKTKN